jgi:hypothetical protein
MTMPAYTLPRPPIAGRRKIATAPMKQAVASSLRKHADRVIQDHPTMGIHTHLKDAARVLERGNTEGAQRHLNAAIGQLTPQSLQRHGVLTDEGHTAAKRHMDTIHRHLLLVKDIEDALSQNDQLAGIAAGQRQADAEARAQRVAAVMAAREGTTIPGQAPVPGSQLPPGTPNAAASPAAAKPPVQPAPPVPPGKPAAPVPPGKSRPAIPAAKVPAAKVAASGQLGAIELAGPKGYVHGWKFVGTDQPTFGGGTEPGSFEHIRAIQELGDQAANPTGDPGHRSPTMQSSLHNVAKSVATRDMAGARIHLQSAKWANRHEAGSLWTRELAALEKQLSHVPAGATGFQSRRSAGPLSSRGQHQGSYVSTGSLPSDVTKGALAMPGAALGMATELSAQTARLAVTPAPRGRPGGPGLYDVAGMGHSAYFQQVVKALIEKRGMEPGKAYAVAWGALRRWRRGGGHVHPEVQAAAGGSLAEEAAKGAAARMSHGHSNISAQVLDLAGFNPAQPRTPVGTWGGGGAPPPAGAKPPAKGATAAQRAMQKKALLLKAAAIRGQIAALLKMLAASKKGKAKSPAAAAAAAKKAAATAAKKAPAARKTTTAKKPAAKKLTRAQIVSKIAVLRIQLAQTLAAAAKL